MRWAEQNALDGPQDGAGTGDVQQVDQAVSPASWGYSPRRPVWRRPGV
mgnify:CR=1 FL=1